MNKEDLVNEVSQVIERKDEAKAAVDCIFKTITNVLKKRNAVALPGFGTFKVDQRKARMGRNPRTGETIEIGAKTVPKFVPGKVLRDAVN